MADELSAREVDRRLTDTIAALSCRIGGLDQRIAGLDQTLQGLTDRLVGKPEYEADKRTTDHRIDDVALGNVRTEKSVDSLKNRFWWAIGIALGSFLFPIGVTVATRAL